MQMYFLTVDKIFCIYLVSFLVIRDHQESLFFNFYQHKQPGGRKKKGGLPEVCVSEEVRRRDLFSYTPTVDTFSYKSHMKPIFHELLHAF